MSKLLFSLRNVPDDEADEVRELLTTNGLDYYETSAGNWGISMPALWLKNAADYDSARHLLNEYQHNRASSQRQAYLEQKQQGLHPTFWQNITAKPLHFLAYLAAIAMIIYASVKMVKEFGI